MYHVLRRYQLAQLRHLDRAAGTPIRRYEHSAPGDLVHVDIKKLGSIPDGGGYRVHGRAIGDRNRQRTLTAKRNAYRNPLLGYGFLYNPSSTRPPSR